MYRSTAWTSAEIVDICINISWDGSRDGEYEPYELHSYPLDSDLTLRGIPKLDSSNNLYYDGDTYDSDGTVTRRYGIVTLNGTESWTFSSEGEGFYTALDSLKKSVDYIGMIFADKMLTYSNHQGADYEAVTNGITAFGKTTYPTQNWIYAKANGITTASDFRTWLASNPITLVYELATPTEETAEPYASPQNVDDFGTEEYISGTVVPVGHNTKYPANLRDKLQHLPNMADSDGAYLIRQTNKQMSLEVFRIPKAPTTDGTYTLKATVSGGTPTYTWEAVE